MVAPKPFERLAVYLIAVALPKQRMQAFVRFESQPGEILEDARFVLGPAPDAIVILHPQQHASVCPARQSPHVNRVGHMSEMQVACGRRGVASPHRHAAIFTLSMYRQIVKSD
jgi:hypothetical protein